MELWNQRNLEGPPINTYKATDSEIDITDLYNVFKEAKEFFSKCDYLYAEAVLLSRTVYRMKQKFRSSKDFKALEKVNKALERYFKMKMPTVVNNFLGLIPQYYEKNDTYLPTKNMCDYILVRLQGMARLLVRIGETCKIAADLQEKRIQIGHFWNVAAIAYAMVSRIYVLTKHVLKFTCEIYTKILPYSKKLKNTNKDFLPDDYKFPKDLRIWLCCEWIDEKIEIIEILDQVPTVTQFFDLVDSDDEVEFCNEYINIPDEDDDNEVEDVKKEVNNFGEKVKKNIMQSFADEDIGEIIPESEENANNVSGIAELKNVAEVIVIEDKKKKKKKKKKKVVATPAINQELEEDIGEVVTENEVNISGIAELQDNVGEEVVKAKKKKKKKRKKQQNSPPTVNQEVKNVEENTVNLINDDDTDDEIILIENRNVPSASIGDVIEIKDAPKKKRKKKNANAQKNPKGVKRKKNASEDMSKEPVAKKRKTVKNKKGKKKS